MAYYTSAVRSHLFFQKLGHMQYGLKGCVCSYNMELSCKHNSVLSHAIQCGLSHEVYGCFLSCEELKLLRCLPNKHLQPAHCYASLCLSILQARTSLLCSSAVMHCCSSADIQASV